MASDVLLVIPAVCELQRLPAYLRELATALATADYETKILIVDDGSPPDQQQKLLEAVTLGKIGNCEIVDPILLPENRGKGYAIIEGWRSGGDARFYGFVDADGAIPAHEVVRLFDLAAGNVSPHPPCLWASRRPQSGKTVNRNPWRHLLGRLFARIIHAVIQAPVYDNQCGFKIVPQTCYRQIAPLLQEERFCFDIELLLAVHHVGTEVVEVPIDWRDIKGGQFHAVRDGIAMLGRLPAIRRRAKNWPLAVSTAQAS